MCRIWSRPHLIGFIKIWIPTILGIEDVGSSLSAVYHRASCKCAHNKFWRKAHVKGWREQSLETWVLDFPVFSTHCQPYLKSPQITNLTAEINSTGQSKPKRSIASYGKLNCLNVKFYSFYGHFGGHLDFKFQITMNKKSDFWNEFSMPQLPKKMYCIYH